MRRFFLQTIVVLLMAGTALFPPIYAFGRGLSMQNICLELGAAFWGALGRTAVCSFLSAAFSVFIALPASYAAVKFRLRLSGPLNALVITLMLTPAIVLVVPFYLLIHLLNLSASPGLLILLGTFSPVSIFLMNQFLHQISDELLYAAAIDGANGFTIFSRIALPLARPGIFVTFWYTFCEVWNSTDIPQVFLSEPEQYTLSLYLRQEYARSPEAIFFPALIAFAVFAGLLFLLMAAGKGWSARI